MCWSVPFLSETLTILRRASSIAFCTATGTSRALPLPMPIPPSPSPTTARAAKPSTRPPFTTFVTRLTATIFSRSPSERSSPVCILPACNFAMGFSRLSARETNRSHLSLQAFLKLQPCFARGFGQRFHASVKLVARAIESDFGNTELLRLFRNAFANVRRSLHIVAGLDRGAYVRLRRRRAREHLATCRVDHLRVDV